MIDVTCERCGALAAVDWCDVRTVGDRSPVYVMGRSACTTPGCVDDDGHSAVLPPDQPGQLTRADQLWLRRHQRLIREYGQAVRALAEVADG